MNTKLAAITIVFFITTLGVQIPQVAAQDASPIATASPATTQKLKERIEKIVEEKHDQVKGAIDQLSQRKRGFIGEVQRVSQEAITVKTHKGTEIIPMNADVVLLKAGKSATVENISVGDWLIVIGSIENDNFVPKRILISSDSLRPKNHFVALGTITDRSTTNLTLLTRQGETLTLIITKKTAYQDKSGDTAKNTLFTKDMQVLVVGTDDANGKTAMTVRAVVALDSVKKNE